VWRQRVVGKREAGDEAASEIERHVGLASSGDRAQEGEHATGDPASPEASDGRERAREILQGREIERAIAALAGDGEGEVGIAGAQVGQEGEGGDEPFVDRQVEDPLVEGEPGLVQPPGIEGRVGFAALKEVVDDPRLHTLGQPVYRIAYLF